MNKIEHIDINFEETSRLEKEKIAIKIRNVSKTFYVKEKNNDSIREQVFNLFSRNSKRKIQALKNVDLEIKEGEFFGIIGHNGSGKSTLLKMMAGAFPADEGGIIEVKGRLIRLALGMGFDSTLSARENIYINGSVLGLTFKKIGQKFDEIITFAELEKFIDTPVKFYSSGMRSRLAFAIAIHAEADIYLIDEFFGGVGDINFKKKSERVFSEFLAKNKTFVHVSHSLNTIENYCDRVMVLHQGKVVTISNPKDALKVYNDLMRLKKRQLIDD